MSRKFPEHSFSIDEGTQPTAELALSMDVLFHLPSDHDYI
jgi:hypothetical protein